MTRRTELHEITMPKWIWQLRLKGFHFLLRKYLRFIWRSRPHGCNWSRAVRAKYFDRTIRTITRWDRFLLDNHFIWLTDKGTMDHRIGARPYFKKELWVQKKTEKETTPPVTKALAELCARGDTNVPPYTAQQ